MKLVLISDTHQRHGYIQMPKGDVLVHAGDFCSRGIYEEVESFGNWLSDLDFRHVVFIAGNHDRTFEFNLKKSLSLIPERTTAGGRVHYLQDTYVVLDGVKFYGSPWQPKFYNWAFNLPRDGEEIKRKWSRIPSDTDVLVTHCPPHGILDKAGFGNENTGCRFLFARAFNLKPRLHVFGHCHAGYGMNYHILDGTDFVNATIVNDWHHVVNKPVEYEEDFNESRPKRTSKTKRGKGEKRTGSSGRGG